MLEVLKFIFSDFFIWLGTVVLIAVTLQCLAEIVRVFSRSRGE